VEVVIAFDHVFKRIGQREILKDVTLDVKQGGQKGSKLSHLLWIREA